MLLLIWNTGGPFASGAVSSSFLFFCCFKFPGLPFISFTNFFSVVFFGHDGRLLCFDKQDGAVLPFYFGLSYIYT